MPVSVPPKPPVSLSAGLCSSASKTVGPFAARDLDGNDFVIELAGGLRGGEALLQPQCLLVLRLAADLKFSPNPPCASPRSDPRCIIEAVMQQAVVELPIAHAVTPAAARD
jgi:hypothetical protein